MGFGQLGLRFLLAAKACGVSFEHTCMIGRQTIGSMSAPWLQALLDQHGIACDAAKLLATEGGYSEPLWHALGAKTVTSIDASSYENATVIHDLNEPVGQELKERFTVFIDGGTLEHVFNVPVAVRNCMEMIRPGGHFLSVTTANSLMGHGFYQFSPEWAFRVFAPENGFTTRSVMLCELGPPPRFYVVDDPRHVGGRVELASKMPTFMTIIARRDEVCPIFRKTPQQSDYVATWTADRAGSATKTPATPAGTTTTQATSPAATAAPGPSRVPEFLRWHGPVRTTGRRIKNALLRDLPRACRRGWARLATLGKPVYPDWIQNNLGIKAAYYHPASYDDLVAGRIMSAVGAGEEGEGGASNGNRHVASND